MNAKTQAAQRMALRSLVPLAHLEARAYECPDVDGQPPRADDAAVGHQLRRIANLMDALVSHGSDLAVAKFFGDGVQ